MYSNVLAAVDFPRYQRWLDRAAGKSGKLLVFDANGQALCGAELPQAQLLGAALAIGDKAASGVQRHDLDDNTSALYRTLGENSHGHLGWVAVMVPHVDPAHTPLAMDTLSEVLEDLGAALADDYAGKADLEMMTEELGARYEELHLVYAIEHHLKTNVGTNEALFQSLLESAAAHLNVDVVAFIQPKTDVCLYATALSKEIHNLDLVLTEMRGDLYRFVQSSGETMAMNAADDPRRGYIFTDMPFKVLASPVYSNRRIESMVVLVNHDDKPDFTNSDRKLADVLASQLSSLSNTYLLLQSMGDFNQEMAKALIEAVEAKDPYTRGHSERVHHISMEIGRAMGLPPEELDDLHWGSLLHDVGKIGIPDAVLCKPGRLTKDEFTFIKVHPERSYDILRHIKHLGKAVLGARHHQEMYDGSGYPHGLKGEHIPLHGRIIAVADTYDSITSSRAYRPGRSHELAMREIDRVSGQQLDPSIVAVFQRIVATEPVWLKTFHIRREAP